MNALAPAPVEIWCCQCVADAPHTQKDETTFVCQCGKVRGAPMTRAEEEPPKPARSTNGHAKPPPIDREARLRERGVHCPVCDKLFDPSGGLTFCSVACQFLHDPGDAHDPTDCVVCAAQPVETAAALPTPDVIRAAIVEGQELGEEFRARLRRMRRPWEPPAVLPGATTALQARADELAAALAAAKERCASLEQQVASFGAWREDMAKAHARIAELESNVAMRTDEVRTLLDANQRAMRAFAERERALEAQLAESQRWRLAAEGSLEHVNEQLVSANSDIAQTAAERDAAHMNAEHIRRHLGALLDHIEALEAERESDPVRRFLAHERAVSIDKRPYLGAVYFRHTDDMRPFQCCEAESVEAACAAALRALEGSDGNG